MCQWDSSALHGLLLCAAQAVSLILDGLAGAMPLNGSAYPSYCWVADARPEAGLQAPLNRHSFRNGVDISALEHAMDTPVHCRLPRGFPLTSVTWRLLDQQQQQCCCCRRRRYYN